MIALTNLRKEYIINKKTGNTVQALNGVTLSFPERGLVSIVGKSASGKQRF
ncbi:MAG: hypothetical protein LBF12_00560 [Christensenellaceae bacterium]|jgi:ABC-type lipoprotein export system ATPase subunit|nr:hypothetical protein [Christensenellaceae bacterium]